MMPDGQLVKNARLGSRLMVYRQARLDHALTDATLKSCRPDWCLMAKLFQSSLCCGLGWTDPAPENKHILEPEVAINEMRTD
jgi:hypothetical protein